MNRLTTTLLLVLVLALVVLPSVALSDESRLINGVTYEEDDGVWYQVDSGDQRWEIRVGRLGVRFEAEFSEDSVATVLAPLGLTLRDPDVDLGGYYRFEYSDTLEAPTVLAAVLAAPHVDDAYLDGYVKFFATANDSFYVNQWNLVQARVDKAWDITTGRNSAVVAIIDAGFEIAHDDLSGAIWINTAEDINHNGTFDNYPAGSGGDIDGIDNNSPLNGKVDDVVGWDFTSGDNNPRSVIPHDGHGTLVAGIACATRNNGKGVAGVAGGNNGGGARLMPLRMTSYQDASPAIEYAWRNGAKIISMSWGYAGDPGGAVSTAIENAYSHGVVLFAATGNNGLTGGIINSFPSTHPDVIAVGSTDEHDAWVPLSNYGPHLDLVAPSTSRFSPDPAPYVWSTDDYLSSLGNNPNADTFFNVPSDNKKYCGRFSGTSAACPFAAGVAALLKSYMPSLTSPQMRQRLLSSAVDVDSAGFDWKTGWGRVDAYRALTEWGTITGHVVWRPEDTADSTRYISGDLTVAAGDTLEIMPGTRIRIANDDDLRGGADTLKIEINVEGTLIADGTVAHPIVFESWHPTTTEDWVGFYFDSLSDGGTFDHCHISRAEDAIESYVPLTVNDCIIDSCRYRAISSLAGGAVIQGSQITNSQSFGIYFGTGSNTASIRNTIVDGAVGTALHVQPSESVTIRNSIFMNAAIGLFVNAGLVDIDSSSFFYQNDTGIHFNNAGTSSTIRRSGITWNTSGGILCDSLSSPYMFSNTFAHNGGAIYCSNSSSPIIEQNYIQSAGNAITATSGSHPDVGRTSPSGGQSPGNNKIAHASKYISNSTGASIWAQNNCWDVNSGACSPSSAKFTGTVDYSDPNCCSFPTFSHDEGEPDLGMGFVFNMPSNAPSPKRASVTAILGIVPNPFNPQTRINYSLASQGHVEIKIYDVSGRLVDTLANESQVPGPHSVVWKGTDRRGSMVASGVYFVRMNTAAQVFTRKIVLLK